MPSSPRLINKSNDAVSCLKNEAAGSAEGTSQNGVVNFPKSRYASIKKKQELNDKENASSPEEEVECTLVNEQDDFFIILSNLNTQQKVLVTDFALAVQAGPAAIGAFMYRCQEAMRVQNWRDLMPPEKKAEQRAKGAARARKWRSQMSPQEAAQRRAKDAAQKRDKRAKLTLG